MVPNHNSEFLVITFLFSCIELMFLMLGIFLIFKRLENNFTIFIDNKSQVFFKNFLNKSFYEEMLLLKSDKDLINEVSKCPFIDYKKYIEVRNSHTLIKTDLLLQKLILHIIEIILRELNLLRLKR